MTRTSSHFIRIAVLLIAIAGATTAITHAAEKQKTKPQQQPVGPAASYRPTDPSLYAGSDVCAACHDAQAKSYNHGPHWKNELQKGRGPAWQGCEACHGPGKEHVENGGDLTKIIRFTKLSAADASRRCLDCHELGEEHSNFMRSEHLKNGVGCTTCHSVHEPTVERYLLKASQPQLCYGCHLNVKPDFSRPFHHRVNEGLLTCSNCHNQHGSFLTKQLRSTAAQDQLCFNCHTDKAGPFAFEHAPVKVEGCVTCHAPHGSSNPRLLRRSNINLLCLECHTLTVDSAAPAAPSFHNQAQKYQACTMCHVAIHGSNSDHFFFKP